MGITKNNKHSFKDYGLTLASRSISIPKKNKITATVPFMNGSYDFSCLYGEQTYEERTLEYKFNVIGANKIHLNMIGINVLDWLLDGNKMPLYDDAIPDFYFLAECEEASFNENLSDGQITAKFKAYPFKISVRDEGNDIWDEFNFELDIVQETSFNVNGVLDINLTNSGIISAVPEVICSNDITIKKKNISYLFKAGKTKDYRFKLDKGINNLRIIGNGIVEFKFRKEVL